MNARTSPKDGPWLDEPDWLEFTHAGFACRITRVPGMGHLCGYVALPLTHPCAGLGYDAVPVSVHGGWTYAKDHFPGKRTKAFWVLGFDCGHANDYAPYMPQGMWHVLNLMCEAMGPTREYRTIDYVRAELISACDELALLAIPAKEPQA